MSSVTVVGGGVVGLCTAHFLDRAGYRVTVVERAKPGSGASRGNAGEISPELVAPLPAPGVIGQALRGLPSPDSALYVRPRPNAALLRFLWRFGVHTSRRSYTRGAQALGRLADGSRGLFEELETTGVTAAKDGYLFAFASRANADAARREQQLLGAPVGEVIDGAELDAFEPALGSAAAAGFHVANQWWIDPSRFVDALAADLTGRGVRIVEGARVTSMTECGRRPVVHSTSGDVEGDAVVVAAGTGSRDLCRRLGVDVNLFPGKGYSFSVAADPMPRRVVHLGDARVVFTPMAGRLRVAGTMEFDDDADAFRPRRIEAIVGAARRYLRAADWRDRTNEWVGARVLTPDGLPAIGRVPGTRHVLLASGHNMLGLMLSPVTGRLVTDILTGDADPHLTAAFDPRRLARPIRRRPQPN